MRDRRFVDVGGHFGSDARLAVERQVHHAPHVEGGHGGGGEADRPEHGGALRRAVGLPENLVLGEEAGEAGNAGDGHAADPHGPEGDRDLVLEAAHAPHVLLAAHGVDHGAGAEEEQRLEEGVGEQVEDRDPVGADAERQEHVAELADGGVGEDALDIGLHQRDAGGQDRGEGADGSDDGGGDRASARTAPTSGRPCRRRRSPWSPRGSGRRPAWGLPWRRAARRRAGTAPICRWRRRTCSSVMTVSDAEAGDFRREGCRCAARR